MAECQTIITKSTFCSFREENSETKPLREASVRDWLRGGAGDGGALRFELAVRFVSLAQRRCVVTHKETCYPCQTDSLRPGRLFVENCLVSVAPIRLSVLYLMNHALVVAQPNETNKGNNDETNTHGPHSVQTGGDTPNDRSILGRCPSNASGSRRTKEHLLRVETIRDDKP